MFSKAYDIIRTFIFHFFLAKRGKVKAVSAFSVFTLLSGLYIKALLHPGKEKIITTKIFNYTVSAYGYGDLLYLLKEVFLSETYAFTSTSERPAILDCGANIGMSILYFKMLYPNCSIIAFEPNPFVFELLKRMCFKTN